MFRNVSLNTVNIILLYLDGQKKTQDTKSTKYLQKIEHTGTDINVKNKKKKPRAFESVEKI